MSATPVESKKTKRSCFAKFIRRTIPAFARAARSILPHTKAFVLLSSLFHLNTSRVCLHVWCNLITFQGHLTLTFLWPFKSWIWPCSWLTNLTRGCAIRTLCACSKLSLDERWTGTLDENTRHISLYHNSFCFSLVAVCSVTSFCCRFITEEVTDMTTSARCASYITKLRDVLWPNGVLDSEEQKLPSEEQRAATKTQARHALYSFFPGKLLQTKTFSIWFWSWHSLEFSWSKFHSTFRSCASCDCWPGRFQPLRWCGDGVYWAPRTQQVCNLGLIHALHREPAASCVLHAVLRTRKYYMPTNFTVLILLSDRSLWCCSTCWWRRFSQRSKQLRFNRSWWTHHKKLLTVELQKHSPGLFAREESSDDCDIQYPLIFYSRRDCSFNLLKCNQNKFAVSFNIYFSEQKINYQLVKMYRVSVFFHVEHKGCWPVYLGSAHWLIPPILFPRWKPKGTFCSYTTWIPMYTQKKIDSQQEMVTQWNDKNQQHSLRWAWWRWVQQGFSSCSFLWHIGM